MTSPDTFSIRGLYDDDRSLSVEAGVNGELSIKVGNQLPIFVFAEDALKLVTEQARNSLAALPRGEKK